MDTSIPLRRCRQCYNLFPATREFFPADNRLRDGIRPICKICVKAPQERKFLRLHEYPTDIAITDDMPTKCCNRCKKVLPATTEFFFVAHHYKDGLQSRCKPCSMHRQKKPDIPPAHEGYKRCVRCYQELPATLKYFYKEKRAKCGLSGVCKTCTQKWNTEYSRLHPEKAREHLRRLRNTNKEQYNTYTRNRRARKKAIPGNHTAEDIQKQYKRQRGRCYWCSNKLGTGKRAYHVDHIIPVTREGSTNWPDNIVIACHSCNESRKDKLPHEWEYGGRLL